MRCVLLYMQENVEGIHYVLELLEVVREVGAADLAESYLPDGSDSRPSTPWWHAGVEKGQRQKKHVAATSEDPTACR